MARQPGHFGDLQTDSTATTSQNSRRGPHRRFREKQVRLTEGLTSKSLRSVEGTLETYGSGPLLGGGEIRLGPSWAPNKKHNTCLAVWGFSQHKL